MSATAPYRTNRMDNKLCRELISFSYLRLTGLTSPKRYAFKQQLWSSGSVDRSIHSPTAKQSSVSGIDYCVNRKLSYIRFYCLKFLHQNMALLVIKRWCLN